MILDGTITTRDIAPQTIERTMLALINKERARLKLPPLDWLSSLQMAATWMSMDMARNKYFSHTDSMGRDPFTRMFWCGYDQNAYKGENLAAGYPTAEAAFNGWVDSPGHYSNMIGQHYRYCGIALVMMPNTPFRFYWSLELASLDDPTWTGRSDPSRVLGARAEPLTKHTRVKLTVPRKKEMSSISRGPSKRRLLLR